MVYAHETGQEADFWDGWDYNFYTLLHGTGGGGLGYQYLLVNGIRGPGTDVRDEGYTLIWEELCARLDPDSGHRAACAAVADSALTGTDSLNPDLFSTPLRKWSYIESQRELLCRDGNVDVSSRQRNSHL